MFSKKENINIKNKLFFIFISLSLLIFLVFLDYITGEEITFSYFYIIPISIAVIFTNLKIGILISILASLSRVFIYISWGVKFSSHSVLLIRFLVRLSYYLLHTILLHKFLVLYKNFKELALIDPLTKVYNRSMVGIFLEREIQKSLRTNSPITVSYLDLDNFKEINDSFGHLTGDKLLKLFANKISHIIRANDLFARIGGDEFLLILPETDLTKAKIIVERIFTETKNLFNENNWKVSLSIGTITFTKFNISVDEIIKKTDSLMYKVKKMGKNNIKYDIY